VTPIARKRVLVVDDAGEVVALCVNLLQSLGYGARGATRGDAALDLLRRESFDLVIVDYRMPGMNGFELLEQARVVRPEALFLLLTGFGTADVVGDATARGFHAVLLKPFRRDDLRDAVARMLGDGTEA
jgi:two-component system response regulator (stage 0 sporulation protein F)